MHFCVGVQFTGINSCEDLSMQLFFPGIRYPEPLKSGTREGPGIYKGNAADQLLVYNQHYSTCTHPTSVDMSKLHCGDRAQHAFVECIT